MKRAALALIFSFGCNMFDPELYEQVESAQLTSDSCVEGEVPLLEPSGMPMTLTLDALADDWQVPNCGFVSAMGNEGFFAIELAAGEKLHVHVDAIDDIDPVVYVVDGCDERACQPLNAANHCSTGKEHLSFLAPRTGRYVVGVDSVDPGGGRVELLAVLPECGNGEKQHSEACEDGNVVAGDGCDPFCRFELDASERAELEPNDDLSGGNVLAIEAAGSPFVARGRLEGLCDPEVFSFELTADRNATIRVVAPALDECIVPSPGTAMQITLYYGLTEIARTVSDAEGCLVLDSVPLKPRSASDEGPTATGSYHLQLRALPFDELVPVDYALVIELE